MSQIHLALSEGIRNLMTPFHGLFGAIQRRAYYGLFAPIQEILQKKTYFKKKKK